MEADRQEDVELMPMKLNEKIIHNALIQLLDDESDIRDLKVETRETSGLSQPGIYSSTCNFHFKEENIPGYVEQFEKDAQDDIIVRGSNSQKQDSKCQEEFFQCERTLLHAQSNNSFKKTESQLLNAANAHKEEILAKLGNLTEVNNESNGAAGLCWKFGWFSQPQPFQILFKCLRGVKDKIPKGHYVLKASLLSHLGGHALHWSKVQNHLWAETTLPVYHNGQFYDVEITINHCVHTLLPTEKKIKSGMTLLIELYLLHGKDTYIDRGVAWGVFPLCDNNFNLLEGKFKCPFLRGHYDSKIDRFSKIEDLIMTDLDHWLCNLYFQVIKLPTFENEQDYEVFVQLPQEFLRYASHDEKNSEFEDAKKSVLQRDESKHLHHHQVTTSSIFYEQGQPLASYRHLNIQKELIPSTVENMESQLNIMKGEMDISKETQTKMNQKSLMQYVQVEEIAEQRTVRNLKQKMHKKALCLDTFDTSDISKKANITVFQGIPRNKVVPYVDKQALLLKEDFDTHQKKGKNATFEKRCHSTQKSETDIVKPMEQCSASTSYLEELEKHRFAVCKTLNGMHMYQRIVKHTKLAIWAVFSEMEIGQWRSRDFWSIILMMTLMWFLRLYLHYCSQWLFLQAISIPVVKFTFYPHTVELNYQSSLLHIKEELGVVVIGPISLNVSMLIMILLRWSCQMLFNSFPTIMSKSIIACGLWTMLDPLAVLLMDAFLGRLSYSAEKPIGDAAKLYWIFYRTEQSGTPGIFITMLVYIMIFIISFSVLYLYLLRLHKESWILDVFQRISCNEELFYVPCDLEISNQEMSQIVQKAEQWRGINGERRKVTVYDYNRKKEASRKTSGSYNQQPGHLHSMTFEDDTNDITTHVLIYTIHLSGFQELYRQFLRLPDGAIVEIFGDCSGINQLPNEVSSTVKEHHNELESLDGNSTTADLRERKKSTTSC